MPLSQRYYCDIYSSMFDYTAFGWEDKCKLNFSITNKDFNAFWLGGDKLIVCSFSLTSNMKKLIKFDLHVIACSVLHK